MIFAETTTETSDVAGKAQEQVAAVVQNAQSWWSDFWHDAERLLLEHGITWGMKIFGAIAIFLVGRLIARVITGIVGRIFERTHMTPTLNKFLVRVINGLLNIIIIVAILQGLGVETTSIVAILGAASLAIGLALQGSLSNFAAGILVVLLRPFQLNDVIEIGSVTGTVEEIGIFATKIRTGDNRVVVMPNSALTSQAVTNISAKPTRRIDLVIGISYNDNIKTAKDIIAGVLEADARILKEPAVTIAVAELADSSVNLFVRPWVKSEDYWDVRFDLFEKIKTSLEAGGCSIPFPQRDVHLFQAPAK